MSLPLKEPLLPMEARSADQLPVGEGWQYEPKWDGFRCLAFRDGERVSLQSKSGQPLARYFPELVRALADLPARRFVLDGEIVVPVGDRTSFDELLLRIHPAASRVRKLAAEHPALYVLFDLLVDPSGEDLSRRPLEERRPRLEAFAREVLAGAAGVRLSPAARDLRTARRWFRAAGRELDGVIAKRLDLPYQSGNREGMLKIKPAQTAECVVGGFRYATRGKSVGSLLLGLYDPDGLLHHVGFTASLRGAERVALTPRLEALVAPPGFTGRAPGGPSRWSRRRSMEWLPLAPSLVVEVEYDHFSGGRFRHGTRFLRWRPDKDPRLCTLDQVQGGGRGTLRLLG